MVIVSSMIIISIMSVTDIVVLYYGCWLVVSVVLNSRRKHCRGANPDDLENLNSQDISRDRRCLQLHLSHGQNSCKGMIKGREVAWDSH